MTEQTQPTDAEIEAAWTDATGSSILPYPDDMLAFARAVLAKWGTPAGAGEPVGEVESSLRFTGGFHVRLYRYAHMPEPGTKLYTTPQPTQAQAGAVPTRAFLERTLAAMEGVIDVADRKTDEFDALRSCVIDLTLMLFSDAKRHTKGA